jgi:NADPH2:quinone reductase
MSLSAGVRLVQDRYAESREEAIASLRLEGMAPPDPGSLAPAEVLVRVRSASVSFIDLIMMSGQYQHMAPLPFTPGLEYAGEVAAVGGAVTRFKPGDRVLNDYLVVGPRSSGAYQSQGGWATYALATEAGLHAVPGGFSFDEAANLLLNYETPWYAFVNRARLAPGETVLITGASGAAGMAAVRVAKIMGAKVIATGRSEKKLARVLAQGADHAICTAPGKSGEPGVPRFREQVKALTDGRGADVVFDTVGGEVSREARRSLCFGGRMLIIGWAENTTVAQGGGRRGSANADSLPTNIMQMKGLHVMGSPMVIHSTREPSIRPPRVAQIMAWAAAGLIRPWVSHVFEQHRFREALLCKARGEVNGGCVLHF